MTLNETYNEVLELACDNIGQAILDGSSVDDAIDAAVDAVCEAE